MREVDPCLIESLRFREVTSVLLKFKVVAPARAKHVRVVMMECRRLTSHLPALGHTAEAIGYGSLFMQCFRERERIMSLVNRISGNRANCSMNTIRGVRRDITPNRQRKCWGPWTGSR